MTLDFSTKAWQENLPALGPHQAVISDIKFIYKEDITWMTMTWSLADGGAVEEFHGLDAPPDSPMRTKTVNGRRRINGLCEMHDIKTAFKSHDDISIALVGKSATIVIGHKFKGGMDEPIICGVTAPEKKK
jgi:hypothetical protein